MTPRLTIRIILALLLTIAVNAVPAQAQPANLPPVLFETRSRIYRGPVPFFAGPSALARSWEVDGSVIEDTEGTATASTRFTAKVVVTFESGSALADVAMAREAPAAPTWAPIDTILSHASASHRIWVRGPTGTPYAFRYDVNVRHGAMQTTRETPGPGSTQTTISNASGILTGLTSGEMVVQGEVYSSAGSVTASFDHRWVIAPFNRNGVSFLGEGSVRVTLVEPTLTVDQTSLRFGAMSDGVALLAQTSPQVVRLEQSVPGILNWVAVASEPWLRVTPSSGSGRAALTVTIGPEAAAPVPSTRTASLTLMRTDTGEPIATIGAGLTVKPPGASTPPFGYVDTPLDNSSGLAGAVPVTGWALDDVEVSTVTLCREAVPGEIAPFDARCGGLPEVFIGTASFVDGARPDVQTAFASAPLNQRGGWGFVVLTNTLPGQGNGIYRLTIYATDREGQTVRLGARTIACDNANSRKPFGTIDTPAPGGTTSGSAFINFGWALTQADKVIPLDGSTIRVFVDGMDVGQVDYNHFRPDIAAAFPGLQNSNGAVGFRMLDTTALTNGLHTISWAVTDSGGATEGIGSRFFSVSNAMLGGSVTAAAVSQASEDRARRAPRTNVPVRARRGWDLDAGWGLYQSDRTGRTVLRGTELDRFEVWLGGVGGETYTGYLRVGTRLTALPIGSQLDAHDGVFTWAPGVGFVGTYDFVFVRSRGDHAVARHEVRIVLDPKQ